MDRYHIDHRENLILRTYFGDIRTIIAIHSENKAVTNFVFQKGIKIIKECHLCIKHFEKRLEKKGKFPNSKQIELIETCKNMKELILRTRFM